MAKLGGQVRLQQTMMETVAKDNDNDNDNDNDFIMNLNDDCPEGELSWLSDSISDYDGDGCKDDHTEDDDDDNDGYSILGRLNVNQTQKMNYHYRR